MTCINATIGDPIDPDAGMHFLFNFGTYPLYLDGCQFVRSELNSIEKFSYITLALLSMIGSTFVAVTIFYNKKLRTHPSTLIGYICLCEGISCYNGAVWAINSNYMSCYLGLHYLLSWTVFFSSSTQHRIDALELLCLSNDIIFQFFQILSLMLNVCLCIDLILTLMNPFYPSKRRMKFYLGGSLSTAVILSFFVNGGRNLKNCEYFSILHGWSSSYSQTSNLILAMSLSLYIIVALYSCIFAVRRLLRPGVSKEIRWIFLRKHFFYVAAFICIWTTTLASAYYHLFNPNKTEKHKPVSTKMTPAFPYVFDNTEPQRRNVPGHIQTSVVDRVSIIASLSTGIILTIIRCQEPYFKFLIKKQIKGMFGILIDEKQMETSKVYLNDTLSTFLTSSLNIELVHIILKGITKFSKFGLEQIDRTKDQFKVQRVLTLNKIKIKDPEKWAVARLPDFIENRFLELDEVESPSNQPVQGRLNEDLTNPDTHLYQNYLIINEKVQIVEYAPTIFQDIRFSDDVTRNEIIGSLSTKLNRDMVFKAGESQGKSGSFFFFSHDKKFIIKTMSDSELTTFMRMFSEYYNHITKNKDSLMARIYGVFTVKMEDIVPVNLILMGNTVKCKPKLIFDLKGSSINRIVKNPKKGSTMKDLNLLDICKEKLFLRFSKADRRNVMRQIEKDIQFLCSFGLMDYSLLLAVEKNPARKNTTYMKGCNTIMSKKAESKVGSEDDKIHPTSLSTIRLRSHTVHNQQRNRLYSLLSTNTELFEEVELKKEQVPRKDTEPDSVTGARNEALKKCLTGKYQEKLDDYQRDSQRSRRINRYSFLSVNEKFIYHLSIIDYLQEFNSGKWIESRLKTQLLHRDYSLISAIEPKPYAARFYKFMKDRVVIDAKLQHYEEIAKESFKQKGLVQSVIEPKDRTSKSDAGKQKQVWYDN